MKCSCPAAFFACVHRKWKNVLRGGLPLYNEAQMKTGRSCSREMDVEKGPLLYVMNWAGLELGGWRGPIVFEAASLAMALWFMFRTARLCTNWWLSAFIVTVCSLRGADRLLEEGNLTEEYALPWIALAVYLFFRFFQQGVLRVRDTFWLGFGFAMVLMLRPNMIAAWAVGYPVLFYLLWKQEHVWRPFLGSLAGLLVGVAPFLLWLAANGALQSCWDAYIGFNLQYTAHKAGAHVAKERLHAFSKFFFSRGTAWVLVPCCFAMFRQRALRNRTVWLSLVLMLVSLLSLSMSGMTYAHYGMVLLPTFVYPSAIFLSYVKEQWRPQWFRYAAICMVLVTISVLGVSCRYIKGNLRMEQPEMQRLVQYVQEHSAPTDCISVWGNKNVIYVRSGRRSSSVYSYQWPLITVHPQIEQRYFADLEAAPPQLVLLTVPAGARMEAFLSAHAYEKVNAMPLKDGTVDVYQRPEQAAP